MNIPAEIHVNGKWRPTRNSEGRLIHSTPEGLLAFWKWFGESKVVDGQGRPVVVYHGTEGAFKSFDKKKAGRNYRQGADAFFFSHSTRKASNYAERLGDGANVIPVYLSLRAPYTRVAYDPIDFYDIVVSPERHAFQAQGHDGVIVGSTENNNNALFVAFHPTQIKSATGNRGTFDGADPVMTNPRRRNPCCEDADESEDIISAMRTRVKQHVAFDKDGGVSRDSCWENLADTVVELGLLPTWGPLWWYLEEAFDKAWPLPQRNPRRRQR